MPHFSKFFALFNIFTDIFFDIICLNAVFCMALNS